MATRNTSGQGRQGRNPLNNPREGATTTKEGQKFVFKNGQWVKATPRTHARTGQGPRTAKPAAKTNAEPDWRSKVGNADPKKLSKPQNKTTNKPQPVPAASPKPAAVTSGGGRGSSATPPASRPASGGTAKPSSSRNVGPVANGDEYARNKDPKKYNPLMQKTFGYQKGDAPDQRAAKAKNSTSGVGPVADGKQYAADKEREDKKGRTSGVGPVASGAEYGRNLKPKNYNTPDEKSKYVAPNGKPYAGPGYAQPASPASPAKPPSPNEKKKETLAEAMRRQRTNRYA